MFTVDTKVVTTSQTVTLTLQYKKELSVELVSVMHFYCNSKHNNSSLNLPTYVFI